MFFEHFDTTAGELLLRKLVRKNNGVLISTPKNPGPQKMHLRIFMKHIEQNGQGRNYQNILTHILSETLLIGLYILALKIASRN
jgi:hypothetical protein